MVRARCYVTVSAVVSQGSARYEAVFPVVAAPRLYNEGLKQLESEFSWELSTAKISEKKWHLRQRIELRKSPELA